MSLLTSLNLGPIVTDFRKNIFGEGSNSLSRFKAEISRRGIMPTNRYRVTLDLPATLQSSINSDQLSMRGSFAILPGKNILIDESLPRYGYGPIDKIAHNTSYQDVTVGFLLDDQGDISQMFHRWFNMIHNADSRDGFQRTYKVDYKDNYSTTMKIEVFNNRDRLVDSIVFSQVFPRLLGDITLAYDQMDAVSVLPITFTYIDYQHEQSADRRRVAVDVLPSPQPAP